MVAPYVQQAPWARVVFDVSLAAFAAAELRQSLKRRRDASRANLRAEVAFRVAFFAAVLVLPLAQGVVPEAALATAGSFMAGAVVAWTGLLQRWWSFATLGRASRPSCRPLPTSSSSLACEPVGGTGRAGRPRARTALPLSAPVADRAEQRHRRELLEVSLATGGR